MRSAIIASLACLSLAASATASDVPLWDELLKTGPEKFTTAQAIASFARQVRAEIAQKDPLDVFKPAEPVDVDRLESELNDLAIGAQAALAQVSEPVKRLEAFHRYFFIERGFTYQEGREDHDNLDLILVDTVLQRRQGNDLGLGLVYLAVMEKLVVPSRDETGASAAFKGVWAPGHFFLRMRAGRVSRNVELSAHGEEWQDSRYVHQYGVPEDLVTHGIYLNDLTPAELAGLCSFVRGNAWYFRGKWKTAEAVYGEALEQHRKLVHAFVRRGRCRFENGDLVGALPDFEYALNLIPRLPEAYLQRGRIYHDRYRRLAAEDRAKVENQEFLRQALRDLRIYTAMRPEDPEAYRIRSYCHEGLGQMEEAVLELDRFAQKTQDLSERGDAQRYRKEIQAERFIARLHEADYRARFQAVAELRELGSHRAIPHLIESLSDANVRYRWQVVDALARLTGVDHGDDLAAWRTWWEANKSRYERVVAREIQPRP